MSQGMQQGSQEVEAVVNIHYGDTAMDYEVFNKPYEISSQLTVFYSKSVGRPIDLHKEISILLDWKEAIEACSNMAKTSRNRPTLNDMKKFKEECAMFMECNSQK